MQLFLSHQRLGQHNHHTSLKCETQGPANQSEMPREREDVKWFGVFYRRIAAASQHQLNWKHEV